MSSLEETTPLLLKNRHTKDIHIQILYLLQEKPCTYETIKQSVRKDNGDTYSKSYIRKALSDLQKNNVVRKHYVTHKYTFYAIVEWETFVGTWSNRRKKIKRNLFNTADRTVPSLQEIESKKEGEN